ncbi:DegV family protein [Suilimivivens aceti]|uniref:DegV family protein n=1 Tax=Suilimivivens aceti TaxID=2981774 RepID=A0ABT2T5A9_9FIRM|nr:DegV family protein [Suilimivivens aceti]MCU6745031.1 DegV family protein [Suilimivivens aceti]SCI02822.1 DegV domain-containing protein SAV1425 [uncultured Clostridium sp.]
MNKKVNIIVDSTADITEDVKERLTVVPLTLRFGDEEYIEGVTIQKKEFYQKLIESDVLPKTSQASPADFEDVFEKIVAAGESAVVITLSSKLSGTWQSAMIAAREYEDSVYVVDSRNVAIGTAILAKLALRLVDEGMGAREIAERLEKEREKICLIAMLDTLEYLKKGGRISAAAAFAGGVLSIKPVVCIRDGEIVVLGKARGSKQGNNLLVSEIRKTGGIDFTKPILLGYTGLDDTLLQKYIEDSKALWEEGISSLETTMIGSVIGTHAGPGAVAVAFFSV